MNGKSEYNRRDKRDKKVVNYIEQEILREWEDWAKKVWPEYYENLKEKSYEQSS